MNPALHPERTAAAAPDKGTPSFLIENHDEAYYLWRKAGVKNMTLVHVDAHHDMWPIPHGGPTTVGNFIFRAMRDGIVGDVFWVVPDASLQSEAGRESVQNNLRALEGLQIIRSDARGFEAKFLGRTVTVCSAGALPAISDEILLDVDVDYFVLPEVHMPGEAEVPEDAPWRWPQELAETLPVMRSRMTTIAYSVNGGTTPIRWKHLGDELRDRWSEGRVGSRYFELVREAWAARDGEHSRALLREASTLRPDAAAAHWHLAESFLKLHDVESARVGYQRAVSADPSYGGAFNSAGFCLEEAGRLDEAENAYRCALEMNGENPFALCGVASIAATRKDWATAASCLQRVAAVAALPDAHRLLGDVLFARGETQTALGSYEAYLELLRAGKRCLQTPISTHDNVEDFFEVEVRTRMVSLYRERGDFQRAEEGLRWLSGKTVPRRPVSAMKMTQASLLLRQSRCGEASLAVLAAVASLPADVARTARWLSRAKWKRGEPSSDIHPVRNVMLNGSRMIFTSVGTLATSAIIARNLGPVVTGQYSYAIWIAGVMVALCHFGLPTTLTKFVAECLGQGDPSGAASLVRKVLVLQLVIIALVSAGGAIVMRSASGGPPYTWVYAVLLVAPMALQQTFIGVVMGAQSYGRLTLSSAAGTMVQLALVIVAWRAGGSITQFFAAAIAANVILAFFYFLSAYRSVLRTGGSNTASRAGIDTRALWRFSGPVAYLVLLDMIVWQRSEILFLRGYSVWQEIAFYSLAYIMVNRLSEVLVSATSTLLPLQANRSNKGVKVLAETQMVSLVGLQLVLLPICLFAGSVAKPFVIALYGSEYRGMVPVLWILLMTPLAVSFTDVSIASLYALGKQKSLMLPLTCTALLNIALAFSLVPRWGAVGAAAANTSAQLMEGLFLLFFSASALAMRIPWRRLAKLYAVAVCSFLPAISVEWQGRSVAWSAVTAVAGACIYFAALVWMREITGEHWRILKQALPRGRRLHASAA